MSHESHHSEGMATSGEVHEIREEEPEIETMHIENSVEGESGRQRTESTASVNSESWQNSDEMMMNMRRAQSLLDQGASCFQIIQQVFPEFDASRFENMSERVHFKVLSDLLERAPTRQKLFTYNSLSDAVDLFRTRKNILVLTGAGVSVSCGIPDFRSKDGIYARLRSEFPNLPDPTAMFDIRYFRDNPAPFYNFAREIFPGQFTPSVSHRFIKQLESSGRLLRNYTQNIDTLEHQTGIKRVVECHGSFSKCTCTSCGNQTDGMEIREDVLAMKVARCKICHGVIKPNIVFFGEDLGREFHRHVTEDKDKVDLIVVIGSSLKVRPVALIPHCVDKNVPQILINRESLPHYNADIELLGNCDDIVRDICYALGGSFAEMIASYDACVERSPSTSRAKRQLITQQEFLNICAQERRDKTPVPEPESSEPSTKRPRMSTTEDMEGNQFQQIQKHTSSEDDDEDNTRNSDEVLREIKHPRLISITDMLNDKKCVAISAYQTVFPGAECSFDMETLKLVHDVPHRNRHESDSSCESCSTVPGSDKSEANPLSRSQSTDDIVYAEIRRKEVFLDLQRCDSCDNDLQYELSDPIDPETFAKRIADMCIE
ncbi:Protein CBR-SIR-2.1 [Caenorhabditis briggsae]|uniref:NAD-dependent protein deacetylase sir-2.1 n=3 Tax=Caenorhabditis briggsae TaxID=6238 RepID=SIR2_CAEBR|nr:Protein CBR-SIR-2.1 [Caenorhabditis briggsae]Q60L58.1 RecName: Full=NAD-dependent protein deacetylase sir-2.1; AltName: Full=Protein sir-2.1; AltName: Full=Regulatory protein SIR2 homolog 1 [Caenorhabditis briggsae]ULT97068.1 hypothetical protein L3Y34_005114 [Caenorhabditis briggsae]CAP20522.3 Protein CBR-SIR-2.1 [Caenorhabditis briggsae]